MGRRKLCDEDKMSKCVNVPMTKNIYDRLPETNQPAWIRQAIIERYTRETKTKEISLKMIQELKQ